MGLKGSGFLNVKWACKNKRLI